MKINNLYSAFGSNIDLKEVDNFYKFMFKHAKKVLIVKTTPFVYTKENVEKVIRKSSQNKCKEYSDIINKTLYFAWYIKNRPHSEERYQECLKRDVWQSKKAITEERINKLIEESDNKTKGPSKATFKLKNRFFIIPEYETKNEILDYSIYKLDDKLKDFLYYNRYNMDLLLDGDFVKEITFLAEDHALAISEHVGDSYHVFLNDEEYKEAKELNIGVDYDPGEFRY